jgi:hypothetical protein
MWLKAPELWEDPGLREVSVHPGTPDPPRNPDPPREWCWRDRCDQRGKTEIPKKTSRTIPVFVLTPVDA